MVSNSDIIKLAKNYKAYVEKHKKNPSNITIDGKKYNYRQCIYLFSGFVLNPTIKEISVLSVEEAKKPTGDTVNENIFKDDYLDMAKRLNKYIKVNQQLPNYLVTVKSKSKIRPRLYAYSFAKIVVFYANNKQLPKYVSTMSSSFTSSSTLYNYLTNKGCSGMGQCTGYYCACNSLQQSFYRLTGILVPEATIASVAGTTTSGTGHAGIETAVAWFNRKYNKNVKIKWANFSDLGSNDTERWKKIDQSIKKGAVFFHLLYRNQWGHYEPIKEVGSILKILNSLGDSCGGATYCGYIEERSKATQKQYMQGISQKSVAILTNG